MAIRGSVATTPTADIGRLHLDHSSPLNNAYAYLHCSAPARRPARRGQLGKASMGVDPRTHERPRLGHGAAAVSCTTRTTPLCAPGYGMGWGRQSA
jgi:hypothetical protein